jgi:hypothetical protein
MSKINFAVVSFIAILVMGTAAAQSVPKLISYQGQLNNQSGVPVNGNVGFVLSIYDIPTGGTALWTENQTIAVANGVFNVQLGTVNALPSAIFMKTVLYLGIRAGADQEMTPRQRITSGAFAQTAEQITGQVQGDNIAREAVWPVHEGRNNTIRSYFASGVGTEKVSFVMPADKKFIITDITYSGGSSSSSWIYGCAIAYELGGVSTTLYATTTYEYNTATVRGLGRHDSFRAGLPVPAGATLIFSGFGATSATGCSCVVAGFEIPATP